MKVTPVFILYLQQDVQIRGCTFWTDSGTACNRKSSLVSMYRRYPQDYHPLRSASAESTTAHGSKTVITWEETDGERTPWWNGVTAAWMEEQNRRGGGNCSDDRLVEGRCEQEYENIFPQYRKIDLCDHLQLFQMAAGLSENCVCVFKHTDGNSCSQSLRSEQRVYMTHKELLKVPLKIWLLHLWNDNLTKFICSSLLSLLWHINTHIFIYVSKYIYI